MTLNFKYKVWHPFVRVCFFFFFFFFFVFFSFFFFFSTSFTFGLPRHMLRHFYNAVLAVIVQVLEQRFLLKLNALDDLLSK